MPARTVAFLNCGAGCSAPSRARRRRARAARRPETSSPWRPHGEPSPRMTFTAGEAMLSQGSGRFRRPVREHRGDPHSARAAGVDAAAARTRSPCWRPAAPATCRRLERGREACGARDAGAGSATRCPSRSVADTASARVKRTSDPATGELLEHRSWSTMSFTRPARRARAPAHALHAPGVFSWEHLDGGHRDPCRRHGAASGQTVSNWDAAPARRRRGRAGHRRGSDHAGSDSEAVRCAARTADAAGSRRFARCRATSPPVTREGFDHGISNPPFHVEGTDLELPAQSSRKRSTRCTGGACRSWPIARCLRAPDRRAVRVHPPLTTAAVQGAAAERQRSS